MHGWALSTPATCAALRAVVEAAFAARGIQAAKARDAATTRVQLLPHPDGTMILVEDGVPDLALAQDLTARLGAPTRYLELDLEDRAVSGRRTPLPDVAFVDVDEEAGGILHDWNDGETRKFYSESYPDLAAALLDVDGLEAGVNLLFATAGSPRVAALLRVIRSGGTWQRTTLANQPAIRVAGAGGTQISVLTPAEEAELLAALDRGR